MICGAIASKPLATSSCDHLIHTLEIVALGLFTVMSGPFLLVAFVSGLRSIFGSGLFVVAPAVGGGLGLWGLWSVLGRSDESLEQDEQKRSFLIACLFAGVVTDAALMVWAIATTVSSPDEPFQQLAHYAFWLLLLPMVVAAHHLVRLYRFLKERPS